MKKKTLFLGVALSILTLVGCEGYETGKVIEGGAWRVVGDRGDYDVLRDTETGCLYLQSTYTTTSVTPYYDEDGKVMGCGEEENFKY